MTCLCLGFGFRNKEKSGSQPACLDHVPDRRALVLKAHQSESHLPIGRCEGVSEKGVVVWPWSPLGFSCLNKPLALKTPCLQPGRGGLQSCLVVAHWTSSILYHSGV